MEFCIKRITMLVFVFPSYQKFFFWFSNSRQCSHLPCFFFVLQVFGITYLGHNKNFIGCFGPLVTSFLVSISFMNVLNQGGCIPILKSLTRVHFIKIVWFTSVNFYCSLLKLRFQTRFLSKLPVVAWATVCDNFLRNQKNNWRCVALCKLHKALMRVAGLSSSCQLV